MIKLRQFPTAFGLPYSMSPFCAKLEAYLRLADVPYEVRGADMRKAPRGKAPYIEHEGQIIGDSSLIIEWCKATFGDPLDADLTPSQLGIGHSVQRMCEEHLYWILVYGRWIEQTSWPIYRVQLRAALPAAISGVLAPILRRGVRKTLQAHGIGRHGSEEIYKRGIADVAALTRMIGDKPFLLGDAPTSFDCMVWSLLAGIIEVPLDTDLQRAAKADDVAVAYVERMNARLKWTT